MKHHRDQPGYAKIGHVRAAAAILPAEFDRRCACGEVFKASDLGDVLCRKCRTVFAGFPSDEVEW